MHQKSKSEQNCWKNLLATLAKQILFYLSITCRFLSYKKNYTEAENEFTKYIIAGLEIIEIQK